MSNYCTVQDVRYALAPGGAQTSGTAASMDNDQIEDAIREASGTVDLYMQMSYQIPTEQVDADEDTDPGTPATIETVAKEPVRSWTRNIAAYLLTLTYFRNKDLDENDPIRLRYNLSIDSLRRVESGELLLPFDPADNGSGATGVEVVNQYTGVLFDSDDFGLGYGDRHHIQHQWPRQGLGYA